MSSPQSTGEVRHEGEKLSWSFPRTFWFANGAELCERGAYYGMFITLMRYLNQDIGFTDVETGTVSALFAGGIYFLPTFMGIMADKIGFKQALMLAFTALTAGYALLGLFQLKPTALIALFLIMCGGAIIKPVISGTVAKCSDDAHRARAMSIFYMIVNIGSFTGKGLAAEMNETLGLQYINYYAAGMSFTALLLVSLFYVNVDTAGTGKTVKEALRGLWTVMRNFRFLSLIVIIAGFWLIQGQLYGAMPTFIERVLGKGYKPEWLANINPLTVVILVVPITHLIRRFKPENAIGIGLFIIPMTALAIALATPLENAVGRSIDLGIFTMHPLIMMIILGVGLQGLAECFLSPKFLEYASKQAPKGEVGLYLGYQHLTTFLAWIFGFFAAGVLLDSYCPDPRGLEPAQRHEWRLATDPEYLFTLDSAAVGSLAEVEGADVPTPIAESLTSQNLPMPSFARFAEIKDEDSWLSDPERHWRIEEPLLLVEEQWTTHKPGWLFRGEPDSVVVSIDGPRWAKNLQSSKASIELSASFVEELGDDQTISDTLRAELAKHGLVLPEGAASREIYTDDDDSKQRTWRVMLRHYAIDESKLETDADAADAGRSRAHRDVLVYGTTARTADETPPLPDSYANANYIWFAFCGIGVMAFFGLLLFKFVTNRIDKRAAQAA